MTACPNCGYLTCPTPDYCARRIEEQERKQDLFCDDNELELWENLNDLDCNN